MELNGSKHFISNVRARRSHHRAGFDRRGCAAQVQADDLHCRRGNPGLNIQRKFRRWAGTVTRSRHSRWTTAFVPDSHVLGEPGEGFKTIMATINNDRVYVSSKCLGMAQELMDLVTPWVKERETFGQQLGQHQAIQFYLADCDVELNAARLLTRQAAALGDAGHPDFRIAASRAKLFSSEMLGRVADRVLQIFGGAGYMTDLPVERIYRDARAFRIGEGTSEMQRLQIARHLLAA